MKTTLSTLRIASKATARKLGRIGVDRVGSVGVIETGAATIVTIPMMERPINKCGDSL